MHAAEGKMIQLINQDGNAFAVKPRNESS